MTLLDFVLFHLWRRFPSLAPVQAHVYVRGERSELAQIPGFIKRYRAITWVQMSPREQRFITWLGWKTPVSVR